MTNLVSSRRAGAAVLLADRNGMRLFAPDSERDIRRGLTAPGAVIVSYLPAKQPPIAAHRSGRQSVNRSFPELPHLVGIARA